MIVAVTGERAAGERRVGLTPAALPALTKAGWQVVVERGAGEAAGFLDRGFEDKGARLAADRAAALAEADVHALVRPTGGDWRAGQIVIGLLDPLGAPHTARELARSGVTAFALELLPRITRAQAMDALSSMATVAGYRAVLLAAVALPRFFPLLMTAAGTVTPARVLILGAGVAGLQAIATARRLGAVVAAYDVRPAVKQEVASLGARFVELPLATGEAAGEGGYARAQDEAFYQQQRELLADVIAEHDVVISTAAVPGRRAPLLITRAAVERMAPGSVIVDLAMTERGGNCELARPDETVVAGQGVTILGPTNLPATAPYHASQMYSRNVAAFLLHLTKDGALVPDWEDEIVKHTLVARDGEVVNPRVRQLLAEQPPPRAEEAL